MPALTPDQQRMMSAAALHLSAAVGGLLALALDRGEPLEQLRPAFLQMATELFDESAQGIAST